MWHPKRSQAGAVLPPFPIEQIDQPLLLATLQKIESRGAIETAHRLRQRAEAVFDYAISLGFIPYNPAERLRKALKPVPPKRRWPALIEIEAVRQLMRRIDSAAASPVVRLSSRFLALLAQRPGMIRHAEWTDFEGIDWAKPHQPCPDAVWRVPAQRMKQELALRQDDAFDHVVPLVPAAVEVLRAVRPFTIGSKFVFCSSWSGLKPMSENSLSYMYKREGYAGQHVPHGWRSSFSTIMNGRIERRVGLDDAALRDRLIIDMMLAHTPSGMSPTELIYNRSRYMERRRELAQEWADLILVDAIAIDEVISGRRRKVA